MAAESWDSSTALTPQKPETDPQPVFSALRKMLEEEPFRVHFFQAVRLLQKMEPELKPVGLSLIHIYSLKEVHAEGLFFEHFANSGKRGLLVGLRHLRSYSSAWVPALGGHFPRGSFRRLLRAVSCEKLFVEA